MYHLTFFELHPFAYLTPPRFMPTALCAGQGLGEKEDSSLDNLQMFVFVGSSPVPKVHNVCVFFYCFCVCVCFLQDFV